MYMMLVFDNPMAQGVLALHAISRSCVAREGLWKLVNRITWGFATLHTLPWVVSCPYL